MSAPTITALPTAPSRNDAPATFVTEAEAFVEALVDLPTEINAFGDYIDGLGLEGTSWKTAVRAATTAAGTLATDFDNGSTIDGVTIATGDRILIKDQAAGAENGIYVVAASGAPTRATDSNAGSELVAAGVIVSEGTTNADTIWICTTNATITLGTTALTFTKFTGGGYAPGGTDVAVADGGTGASTAAGARTNLGLGSIATLDETTAAQYRANTADKALSTDQVWAAAAAVALTPGTNVSVDLSAGINFTLAMGGNYTLDNPTNGKAGQCGVIEITQDGTGSRTLAYGTAWKFAGGTDPVLTTTASAKDLLFYQVLADGTAVFANLVKAVA